VTEVSFEPRLPTGDRDFCLDAILSYVLIKEPTLLYFAQLTTGASALLWLRKAWTEKEDK